jgi:putative transposase
VTQRGNRRQATFFDDADYAAYLALLVDQAWDYPWSSAAARVLGREDPLLALAPLDGMVDDWREFLAIDPPDADLAQFRMHAATGRPLGSEAFVRDLEGMTGRCLAPRKRGPKAKTRTGNADLSDI